ncbi:probable cytochrome P450 4ac1 [Musca autumnalis]|uniref:probable cytochrome P450 4ac1 n=1 Tax=Musca autumnalis TaxID=221902 RepID=UPI003CF098AA
MFQYLRQNYRNARGNSYLFYFMLRPMYNITNAEDAAELFQSTALIDKSVLYKYVKPFLGDGLLISSDRKWFSRRKILTPAFHFHVLKTFNDIFKEESLKLLEKLQHLQKDEIEINDIVTEFTLNNVIETALGVKLDDISGSSKYRRTIHDIEEIILERIYNPLMFYNWIFRLFGRYKKHTEDLKIASDFSSKIIQKKREEYRKKKEMEGHKENEIDDFGKKKRYAMLDTLLDEEANGNIDHEGICDEVNTFMFEGYDTTSTCLIFTILNLALHPEVQQKCREEIANIGDYSSLTVFDFNKLEYLECVLKETLRLYPSVPFIARNCTSETHINGLILPKNSQINVHVYDIMRDPRHFPNPTEFKPERFTQENSVNRHPFAFVPFSAGSRNCIGQKFAILEMKAMLVALLSNFEILPVTKLEDLIFEYGLILRTKDKIYVKLRKYFVLCLCKRISTEDGSKLSDKVHVVRGVVPAFGNNFDLLKLSPETIFQFTRKNYRNAGGNCYIYYFFTFPMYNISTAEDAAELFQNTTLIEKSIIYDYVKPFLGDGLLISSDRKWFHRRKLLTPAFHFNVLKTFNEIFKEESLKLLKKLQHLQKDEIEINDIVTEFTLNNVIETALGVKLDDISGSSQYRRTIHDIEEVILERIFNPLMYFNWIFRLFGRYKKHKEDLKIASNFSSKIIQKKREEYRKKKDMETDKGNEIDDFGKKKRYAMLDTLLDEEANGNIDHEGICDEVNTFMFEGYDTTSTCLIFTILNLALHPEVQKKCREEIADIGDFSSLTVFDFNKLEHLECVLKETLRLYPSVPFIARNCTSETHINGLILPKNSQINVHVYDIMRDPRHFPNPTEFQPERFTPENSVNRHPFAFVPFSAGSRNCIGQKFAILEMKAMLVALLSNFEILPVTKLDDLIFEYGLILRTKEKIYVKLWKF